MKTYQAICKKTFDPYFGFKKVKENTSVQIDYYEDDYGGDYRLKQSEGQTFPNFGLKLMPSELHDHFRITS